MEEQTKKNRDFGLAIRKFLANDKVGAILIVAIMCVFLIIATSNFATMRNILTLLRQSSFYLIVTVGVLCVFMGGGLDLSTSGVMCLSAILCAKCAQVDGINAPLIVIILVAVAVGVGIGLINGVLIGYLKLPALIETLGMNTLLGGVTLLITQGYSVNGLSERFTKMGTGRVGQIPIPVIIAIAMCVLMWFILKKMKYGRHLCATGGNEQAAIVSGINTRRVKMMSYILCSVFAAVAGMILCARFQSGQLSIGSGYNLDAISAAVIGGASMTGGIGSVVGVGFGTFVLTILNNGLDLMAVTAYWKDAIQGIVIILAVVLDVARNRLKNSI